MDALPPFAPFPEPAWIQQIAPADWATYVASWLSLASAHLALADAAFARALKDDSLAQFIVSYLRAQAGTVSTSHPAATTQPESLLKKAVFLLTARALRTSNPPTALLQWGFLADLSRVYGKRRASTILAGSGDSGSKHLTPEATDRAEASLSTLKKFLIKNMEARLAGDLRAVESSLQRVNYLISAWPAAGALLLAGSDFLDALLGCFTIMNPPLRRAIVTTTYLSLLSLTEPPTPRYSQLSDVLYALRGAADDHRQGPLNANDSLVAELVTATPILRQLSQRIEASGTSTSRVLPLLKDLSKFKKPGRGMSLPAARLKRSKGKAPASAPPASGPLSSAPITSSSVPSHLHPHKLSQISQIQDLFPDLGSAFIAKLLDEYDDNTEQVVAHLLEGTLPPHLEAADRSENLQSQHHAPDNQHDAMAPRATPPLRPSKAKAINANLPSRHNVFDGDELDNLSLATSKLHFGKHEAATTADDVLRDRSKAPNKAAILSALAAFDADDDERDDTYDADDVGGTVDAGAPAAGDGLHDAREQTLFAAYQATPDAFARDAATRRSPARARLRDETSMTDEALEGWAVMLARNPQQRRRLEAQLAGTGAFGGQQAELVRTSWRASDHDEGEDGEESSSRGGFRGRGRGRGRGGGGGPPRGNVAGPTGERETEQARRRKEASKGSRANHNRRDQRARKMARGGFPG